jgi:autotransporter-associated beta strand protein
MRRLLVCCATVALGFLSADGSEIAAKWFRLVLKQCDTYKDKASQIRLSEWQLYDGDGAVQSSNLTPVEADPEAFDASKMAPGTCLRLTPYNGWSVNSTGYLFNGNVYAGGNFMISEIPLKSDKTNSMSVDDPATWSYVYIRLSDTAGNVSSYQLFVGESVWNTDCACVFWTLEASHDGKIWFVVDDHTSTKAVKPKGQKSPYNGGVPFELAPLVMPVVSVGGEDGTFFDVYADDALVEKRGEGALTAGYVRVSRLSVAEGTWIVENHDPVPVLSGVVSVGTDGTLQIEGAAQIGKLVNRGAVAVAEDGWLTSQPGNGETAYFHGGGIAGAGGIRKKGAGVLEMDGVNAYCGETVVEEGSLRLGSTVKRSPLWFRLILKKKYSVPSEASKLELGELALYDEAGVQQNLKLRTLESTVDDRLMGPGTCKVVTSYAVSGIPALFDGVAPKDSNGRFEVTGLPVGADKYCAMSPNDPSTWITITMRLREGSSPVEGYNLYLPHYNWSGHERTPSWWTLEASYDGAEWFTVSDVKGATSAGGHLRWFNDGEPFAVAGQEVASSAALPAASFLSVYPGAEVVATSPGAVISRLKVDCAGGAGTVDGFAFAPDGVLCLENISGLGAEAELPVTLKNVSQSANLATWIVCRGETVVPGAKIKLTDGKLVFFGGGMKIILR